MDWSLDPIFGSYFIVFAAAMGLALILFFVRETGRVSRMQAVWLWSLRLSLCVIILLILLRPGITFTRQSTPRGTVAVMLDVSASMQLPSGDGKATRWELEKEIWETLWNARELLGKDARLVPFLYDSTLKPISEVKDGAFGATAYKLPERPEGFSTDIGGPMSQLISSPLERPLSAVIWLGDGAQTHSPAGGDPQQISRRLAQIDVPLFVVGIGPRSDSENSQDLSVEGVPEQLDEFTKNQLNIRGLLQCRGVANKDIIVKLQLVQFGKVAKELSRERLRPTKSDQRLPFVLPLVVDLEPGAYELLVRADPVDPDAVKEAVQENNEATVFLNVRGGGARILYIEGEPRQEQKFIKTAMSESKDMLMNFLTIGKPPQQPWPVDMSKRLSDGVYDCFVLGDLDYSAIEMAGAKAIADQVKKGAGLVTIGGYSAYGAGGWDKSPLAEILPVDITGQIRQNFKLDSPIEFRNHLPGPIQVVPIGANEILQIDSAEKNVATWAQFKPLLGANRWAGIKRIPGTNVLAESQRKEPLIVSGLADQGRVISIAFDTTYLWARQGKSNEHKAFWRKIIYWCLRRDAAEEGMQMSMPQRRLMLQQPSEMKLEWNGGSEVVEMPKNILLHLWKIADRTNLNGEVDKDLGEFSLQRRDGQSMRTVYPGSKEGGRYEWRAKVNGSKGQLLEAKLPFLVVDQSAETLQPMPDWQLLAQLAKLNSTAGGTLVAPEQADEIVRQILERRKQSTQTAIENRRLGDGVLDTWTAFLLLAAVMIGQWTLRKKWNLP